MLDYGKIKSYGNLQRLVVLNGSRKLKISQEQKQTQEYIRWLQCLRERREFNKQNRFNKIKLCNNISRAQMTVFELAVCNEWDWFITLTISPQKFDRSDLRGYYKEFRKFLDYYNKKYKTKVKFLFVPEKHKDGMWHMHGLIRGILHEHLRQFQPGDNVPQYLIDNGYYNWGLYANKFGWCSLDKIKDKLKCSRYITKYITKDTSKNVTSLYNKLYYCSMGLQRSNVVWEGDFKAYKKFNYDKNNFDFRNEFCNIYWLREGEEVSEYAQ